MNARAERRCVCCRDAVLSARGGGAVSQGHFTWGSQFQHMSPFFHYMAVSQRAYTVPCTVDMVCYTVPCTVDMSPAWSWRLFFFSCAVCGHRLERWLKWLFFCRVFQAAGAVAVDAFVFLS